MHPQGRYRTPLLLVLILLLVFSVLSLSLKRSPALRKVQGLVVSMTAPGLEGLDVRGPQRQTTLAGLFLSGGGAAAKRRTAAATGGV